MSEPSVCAVSAKRRLRITVVALFVVATMTTPVGARWAAARTNAAIAPAGLGMLAVSGLQAQNLSAEEPASVKALFFRANEVVPAIVTLPKTPAGGAANMYLPHLDWLVAGSFAVQMSADQPLAAIARTEWHDTGDAMMYSNAHAGTDVVVPLVLYRYAGQTSHVAIMRADAEAETDVALTFTQCGGIEPLSTSLHLGRAMGHAVHLDIGAVLGDGRYRPPFAGAMRVTTDSAVSVSSHVAFENSLGVYGFEGVPADEAASTLYAPLFRNDYYGTTAMAVANAGAEALQVQVTYHGGLGSCTGRQYVQRGVVGPHCSTIFYQGGDTPGTDPAPLPRDCAGSAVIEVVDPPGGRILAVVNDENPGRGSAAYNAASAAQAGLRVALPLFRREHMPDRARLTTGIQAMNVGHDTASIRIRFFDSSGNELATGAGSGITVDSMKCHAWFPPSIPGMPRDVYGSVLLESDQPILVIVNDASFAKDPAYYLDSAIYNGIKADASSEPVDIFTPFTLKTHD